MVCTGPVSKILNAAEKIAVRGGEGRARHCITRIKYGSIRKHQPY